jgi:hypothetical protein
VTELGMRLHRWHLGWWASAEEQAWRLGWLKQLQQQLDWRVAPKTQLQASVGADAAPRAAVPQLASAELVSEEWVVGETLCWCSASLQGTRELWWAVSMRPQPYALASCPESESWPKCGGTKNSATAGLRPPTPAARIMRPRAAARQTARAPLPRTRPRDRCSCDPRVLLKVRQLLLHLLPCTSREVWVAWVDSRLPTCARNPRWPYPCWSSYEARGKDDL